MFTVTIVISKSSILGIITVVGLWNVKARKLYTPNRNMNDELSSQCPIFHLREGLANNEPDR